jgi:ATP-dependent HslUV protease ATP-binding subunit HslU
VKTGHILFMAAGAFHMSRPSDLIPELQGRFPIRVELSSLSQADFVRILTEPKNALTKQYAALLSTEGVDLSFTSEGIDEIARIADEVNSSAENIGARRLHTILEKVLEDVAFCAPEQSGSVVVDAAYVKERLAGVIARSDFSDYVL